MDEFCYITLKCKDCENNSCKLYPNGKLIWDKEGCTRKVTLEERDKFYHYMEEVLPFIRTYKNKETRSQTYTEIIDYLFYLYDRPLGYKLNKQGKIITPKR